MFRARPGPKNFLTPELRRDYFAWLRSRRGEWIRLRKIPPSASMDAFAERLGPRPRRVVDALLKRVHGEDRRRVHYYVVHWAVDRAKEKYQRSTRP